MTVKIISGGTVVRGNNYVDARPKTKSSTQTKTQNSRYVQRGYNMGSDNSNIVLPAFRNKPTPPIMIKNPGLVYAGGNPNFIEDDTKRRQSELIYALEKSSPPPRPIERKTVKSKVPQLKQVRATQPVQQPRRMYVQVSEPSQLNGAFQEAYSAVTGRPPLPRNVTNRTATRQVVVNKAPVANVVAQQEAPVQVQDKSWFSSITSKIYGTTNNNEKKGFLWW